MKTYEVINNAVLTVKEVTTPRQTATVKKYYDQEFHTKVATDKSSILADGVDTATIQVKVYNYLNEAQSDWVGEVVFEVDGIQEIVPTTNGVATTTFDSQVAGEYVIKTVIPNLRNGEVKVVAE